MENTLLKLDSFLSVALHFQPSQRVKKKKKSLNRMHLVAWSIIPPASHIFGCFCFWLWNFSNLINSLELADDTVWKFFSLVTYLNTLPVLWGCVHTLFIFKSYLFICFIFTLTFPWGVLGQRTGISCNELEMFLKAINGGGRGGSLMGGAALLRRTRRERTDGWTRAARDGRRILVQGPAVLSLSF